jgi:glycosyltransferase involved in cell wall biosynthesis
MLNLLDEEDKPEIMLFYKNELKEFVENLDYPLLNLIEWQFPSVVNGYLKSWASGKNIFVYEIINKYDLDAIFPLHDLPVRSKTNTKLISWWADLQHKHYPEFFSKMQIAGRNLRIWFILKNCDRLVLSSYDVLSDFKQYYRTGKTPDFHIYHFVSVIDTSEFIGFYDLRIKYNLPEKYFLVSNQFHKHKNHRILLLAIARLKEIGIIKNVAFTGKLPAASDSPYLADIHKIIKDHNLEEQVTILGVISRNDQLQIMKHSQAVIQPSLFEGWSTVIEDAKSLQVPVIASNLKVNIEQLGPGSTFFDPDNPDELASILANYPERNLNDIFYDDYTTRVRRAAKELLAVLTK